MVGGSPCLVEDTPEVLRGIPLDMEGSLGQDPRCIQRLVWVAPDQIKKNFITIFFYKFTTLLYYINKMFFLNDWLWVNYC